MWLDLPLSLKQIAVAELQAGNIPRHMLRNESRGIVLLSFKAPPKTDPPAPGLVRVHPAFENGNYCYDGTLCTYEDMSSGCFLAFDDPDYVDDL